MANTFPTDLVKQLSRNAAMTSLGPVLGAVNAFAYDVATDPQASGSTVQVDIVTDGTAAASNPTNYETGDTTKVARQVTISEVSKSFHVTQAQLNKGHSLRNLIGKNMQLVANAARDIVFAPITTTNYGAAILDSTAADFVPADLKTIWSECKDFPEKHLLIDGAWYAKLLPDNANSFRPGQSGAYGWDSIAMNNRWDGAGDDLIGFAGGRDALAIASGEPVIDASLVAQFDMYEEVELEGGLSAYVASWASTATRTRWMSIGLMIGAQVGDATAGRVIRDGSV
jgi:hypothetical protein